MKKLLSILTFVGLLIGATAFASQPLFQGKYNITSISGSTNTGWRLIGQFSDTSLLGYGAANAQVGDLVYCYSSMGDIDQYVITNVVSVAGTVLTVDVAYNETGTPRTGTPQSGKQILCRPGYNGVAAYIPSLTFAGIDEYLQNGARNIDLQYSVVKFATSITDTAAVHTNQIGAGLKWDGTELTVTNSVAVSNTIFFLDSGTTSSAYHVTSNGTTNYLGDYFP